MLLNAYFLYNIGIGLDVFLLRNKETVYLLINEAANILLNVLTETPLFISILKQWNDGSFC